MCTGRMDVPTTNRRPDDAPVAAPIMAWPDVDLSEWDTKTLWFDDPSAERFTHRTLEAAIEYLVDEFERNEGEVEVLVSTPYILTVDPADLLDEIYDRLQGDLGDWEESHGGWGPDALDEDQARSAAGLLYQDAHIVLEGGAS